MNDQYLMVLHIARHRPGKQRVCMQGLMSLLCRGPQPHAH